MLKLMKYELRKMRTGILISLCILLAIALFTLLKGSSGGEETMIALTFLWSYGFLGTILYTFFRGPAIYGKELKERTSYLLFMTPNSALKILSAKVLTGLLLTVVFAALYIAAMVGTLLLPDSSSTRIDWAEIRFLLSSAGVMASGQTTYWIGVAVLMAIGSFLSAAAAIYFSETLSATILQGKKGRGGLTLLFWCVITTVIGRLNEWCWGLEQGLVPLPLLLSLALGVIGIWGSAMLLEKKVSL